jgi:hypothetical protein
MLKFFSKLKYFDSPLLFDIILLSFSGLALLYSSSLSSENTQLFWRQVVFFAAGFLIYLFFSFFNYHTLAKINRLYYVFMAGILTYLLVFGSLIRGGCWLNVGWHFAFIIDWFFGAPKSIKINKLQSSKRAWDYGTDDTVFVDCEYNNFHGSGYLSVVDSSSEDVFKIVGGSGTINIYKNHSELIDNNGNILFKEKAENLLGYIYQIKNIPIKEVALKLSLHNFNAMQIINNSL